MIKYLCAVAVLSLLVTLCSSAIEIDRSDEVKYTVLLDEYKGKAPNVNDGISVQMTSIAGKKYNCIIPPQLSVEDLQQKQEEELEPSIEELLQPLSTSCLYRLAGWWTYELCYNKHVRQFHQERDMPIRPQDEFYLGKWSPKVGTTKEEEGGYYSETYGDGTVCDITGTKRSTEVRYFCSPDKTTSAIFDIKEPFSCNYIFSVYTPLLCKHPTFRPKQDVTQQIYCSPIGPDTDEILNKEESLKSVNFEGPTFSMNKPSADYDDSEDDLEFPGSSVETEVTREGQSNDNPYVVDLETLLQGLVTDEELAKEIKTQLQQMSQSTQGQTSDQKIKEQPTASSKVKSTESSNSRYSGQNFDKASQSSQTLKEKSKEKEKNSRDRV